MTSGEAVSIQLISCSVEWISTLHAITQVRYKSFIDAGRQIVAKEGVKALFGAHMLLHNDV